MDEEYFETFRPNDTAIVRSDSPNYSGFGGCRMGRLNCPHGSQCPYRSQCPYIHPNMFETYGSSGSDPSDGCYTWWLLFIIIVIIILIAYYYQNKN